MPASFQNYCNNYNDIITLLERYKSILDSAKDDVNTIKDIFPDIETEYQKLLISIADMWKHTDYLYINNEPLSFISEQISNKENSIDRFSLLVNRIMGTIYSLQECPILQQICISYLTSDIKSKTSETNNYSEITKDYLQEFKINRSFPGCISNALKYYYESCDSNFIHNNYEQIIAELSRLKFSEPEELLKSATSSYVDKVKITSFKFNEKQNNKPKI